MGMTSNFIFGPHTPNGVVFVATVPPGIVDSKGLLEEISEALLFPDCFGNNWNALSDCLCDLSWIVEPTVLLRQVIPEMDLKSYLDVLDWSVRDWERDRPGRLAISFPPDAQKRIDAILGAGTTPGPGSRL